MQEIYWWGVIIRDRLGHSTAFIFQRDALFVHSVGLCHRRSRNSEVHRFEQVAEKAADMAYDCGSLGTCGPVMLGPSLTAVCTASSHYLFMSMLNVLILGKEEISGRCKRVRPVEEPDKVYDFVVVGGSASGCTVAEKLSKNAKWKVLLIEAGLDESAGTQMPAFANKYSKTDNNWKYKTTGEKHACLSTNGSCPMPSAKNLGGNSALTRMSYLKGHPLDYDRWADLGNKGWGWRHVNKYFMDAEDNAEIERVGTEDHGTGGEIPVGRLPYAPPICHAIINASREAGYGVSEDFNGHNKTGFSITQSIQKNGVRRSGCAIYLWPARDRPNLHVSLNSTVTKIIIVNKKAVGVVYYKNGEQKSVNASREVIVSAGAVGSPILLIRSGIGPKKDLESLGIKMKRDLPGVGGNFQNNPCVNIPITFNDTDTFINNWAIVGQYLANQTGPLSGTGTNQVMGQYASNATTPNRPDIATSFRSYVPTCAPGNVGELKSKGRRTGSFAVWHLYPKSRGRITLASKDPFEYPRIRANYLEKEEDVRALLTGIKLTMKLFGTKALRSYGIQLGEEPHKACAEHKFKSDKYWTCVIRQENYPLHREAGTCKMGPPCDRMAVVDSQLRVYGLEGLRVADTSITPTLPASNMKAVAMMIGARAADFVIKDWSCHSRLKHPDPLN